MTGSKGPAIMSLATKGKILVILKWIPACALLVAISASATQRWVPPPAPQIVQGESILVDAESDKKGNFIIHLHKSSQEDWRQTRYEVHIERSDDQPFRATLKTRAFSRDDEVLFLKVAPGSEAQYELEVIDQSAYPYTRVFQGSLASIQEITD